MRLALHACSDQTLMERGCLLQAMDVDGCEGRLWMQAAVPCLLALPWTMPTACTAQSWALANKIIGARPSGVQCVM